MLPTNRRIALSRRQFVLWAGTGTAATSIGFLLAACGPATPAAPGGAPAQPTTQPAGAGAPAPTTAAKPAVPTTAPATAPTTAAAAAPAAAAGTPKRGGTLVMAQASDPNPVPGNN